MTEDRMVLRPSLRLQRFSYRFAEQVLNSKLSLKDEIERLLLDVTAYIRILSRPKFNDVLEERFGSRCWLSSVLCGAASPLGSGYSPQCRTCVSVTAATLPSSRTFSAGVVANRCITRAMMPVQPV